MNDAAGRPISRSDQAEMDRMNRENAEAARTSTTNGSPVVTRGNTGR